MPSVTDLCNDSLGQIGHSRISAIDDGTPAANHCLTFFPALRDAWMIWTHWRFNTTRAQLVQDAATPPFEFAFQYTLPADQLKIIEYNGSQVDTTTLSVAEPIVLPNYRIEGGKLLTNDGQVFIIYLRREQDPNKWNPMFYLGMTALLASKLATAIAKDQGKAQQKLAEGTSLMSLAASIDTQQGSLRQQRADDLVWGRR